MKNTAVTFKDAKKNNEKITMLTAYDYSMAKIIDESGINGIYPYPLLQYLINVY